MTFSRSITPIRSRLIGLLSTPLLDWILLILIVALPFTTILSVFFSAGLAQMTDGAFSLSGVSFYKEILLICFALIVGLTYWIQKKRFALGWLDILLAGYILSMVIISMFTTGIRGIIFGGRYDFEFLLALWITYHSIPLLTYRVSTFIRAFLISGGVALFLSVLIRFVFTEDILIYLGFSGNPSAWQFGQAVPIFHGVDGANIRRFQGIFDGPNTMGGFLLVYISFLLYHFRYKMRWHFVIALVTIFLIGLVFLTYSRSAMLGVILSVVMIFLSAFALLWRKYKQEIVILGGVIFLMVQVFLFAYSATITDIMARPGSSKGHYERMIVGLDRFVSAPFGQGLGSSGPGYRYVQDLEGLSREEIEEKDRFYIPESWYIQQLIEGGIIGAGFFVALFLLLLSRLSRIHIFAFVALFSVCVMNIFLHTFETTTVSLPLFLLLGLILGNARGERKMCAREEREVGKMKGSMINDQLRITNKKRR